jgi:hypothetical protein
MTEQSDIEFRISKTGHLVPIVNQVFLHSIYDPIKEAEVFVESNISEIENNPVHLILGLGFGYHAFKTLEKLKSIHGNNAKVIVIEANQSLVEKFINYANDKNITVEFNIYTGEIDKIYASDTVLNFLLRRPQVLVHRASFQKDKEYYQRFLQFNAKQSISSYWSLLRPGAREYLAELADSEKSIEELAKNAAENKQFKSQDYFLQFINALKNTNTEKII